MAPQIYTEKYLREIIAKSDSIADAITQMGKKVSGGLHTYITKLVKVYEIDTSHFTYRIKNAKANSNKRKTPNEILVLSLNPLSNRIHGERLTRALVESGVPYECKECGTTKWQGKPLTLDVDHIDGNPLDSRIENLRFLCPNCHRQTPTFGNQRRTPNEGLKIMITCACGNTKQKTAKTCSFCYATKRQEKTVAAKESSTCLDCPNKIKIGSLRCRSCHQLSTRGKPLAASTNKILWPSELELLARLRVSNFFALGRELGVSDNAVRKRLRMLGYDPKTLLKLEVAMASDVAEVPALVQVLALELT